MMSKPCITSDMGAVLTAAADPAMIAGLRHEVADLARESGADDDAVRDLELVVSELATNVVQHTDAPTIRMTFRSEPSLLVLDVDDADGVTDRHLTSVPQPEDLTGRGLFIVRSVMDDVEIVDADGQRRLRCIKRLG